MVLHDLLAHLTPGMAEHVRVDGEGEVSRLSDPREELLEAADGHRRAALGGEEVRGRGCLLALETAQGP
jgi:hypothetical protein